MRRSKPGLPAALSPRKHAAKFFLVSWLAVVSTGLAAPAGASAPAIPVTFDFSRRLRPLDGPDGASVCQFHGARPDGSAAEVDVLYSTLKGFPDDSAATEFGKFCDTAFSTNGMALSQLWSTPCPLQTPAGSVGDHYSAEAWAKLDFSMYEPDVLPTNRFYKAQGKPLLDPRGHTAPLLLASVKRARAERLRVCYWVDVHTDFPTWMWKEGQRKNPVRDEMFEEAALHIVYFVKYLTARHGIPIHAASFSNEPDLPGRHKFTPEQMLRAAMILREKLDEAGLSGVRVIPCTAVSMNRVQLAWAGTSADTLNELIRLLEGKMRDHASYVDILAGHASQSEPPVTRLPLNTRYWRASGDFNEHWTNNVGFDMGPPSMLDEVIRHNTWLYAQGVSLAGICQVASRMGLGTDFFEMPETFEATSFGRREAIAGAAVASPHIRPGMWLVEGSQGRAAREAYSVDGFSGPGQREVVLVTNSGEERNFRITTGLKSRLWRMFQATPSSGARDLGEIEAPQSRLYVQAPADSVTAIVAEAPESRPLLTVIVKDSRAVPPDIEPALRRMKQFYDVQIVSQTLSPEDQDRLKTKRHPVDPFGTSAFLLDDSIDLPKVIQAYRTVMAPVVAIGVTNTALLGIAPGSRLAAGDSLLARDALDPPAALLENGLPKACGPRVGVQPRITWADLEFTFASLLKR